MPFVNAPSKIQPLFSESSDSEPNPFKIRAESTPSQSKATRPTPNTTANTSWFWGNGLFLHELKRELCHAITHDHPVLIVGETGTGKEFIAREIDQGRRLRKQLSPAEAPFVAVNCGAIPEALAESILFGHERGAFTSARERQIGRFESARRGTLFLDEIQVLPMAIQVKLLRVLQHREIDRLGSKNSTPIECSVLVASNIPLETLVEQGRFRRDLYYRLNLSPLYLEPLRAFEEDLETRVSSMLEKVCSQSKCQVPAITPEAMEALLRHKWPGNYRELEHSLQYALLRCQEQAIQKEHLPWSLRGVLSSYIQGGDWSAT
jgi:transcriptional regulator with PAS, ATPase and Fis domain